MQLSNPVISSNQALGTTQYISFEELSLERETIYHTMGYGDATPDDTTLALLDELLEEASKRSQPQFLYRLIDCTFEGTDITLEEQTFHTARTIGTLLRRSTQMAVFVATAGQVFQDWMDEVTASGDMLRLFVLDAIGTCIVEAAGDYMEDVLQEEIGSLKHTNRFSPGYCDWHVSEQHKLFSLFPPEPCKIHLTDTALMIPIKSISGFMGVGEDVITKTYGCHVCKKKDCYLRRI